MAISAAVSAIAGGVGAGISYQSAKNAAATNDAFAMANAQAASQAARNQGQMAAAQAQLQAIQQGKDQEAAYANAAGLKAKTEAESRQAQENIRRSREDFARTMAAQRAAVAARGVVDTTGSPLELLVKASEDEQLAEEEMRYSDEIARRSGFRSAALEEVRGAGAGIDQGLSLLSAAAAKNDAALQQSQVRLNLFSERANSTAMRNQAAAGLVSSIGSASRDFYNYRKYAPGKSTTSTVY